MLAQDILRSAGAAPESLAEIGRRVSTTVIDARRTRGEHPRDVIDALCRLASSNDATAEDAGSTLIFTHLVERLSDAFEPDLADLYDAVFSQIIDNQRRRPEGRLLNEALDRFGLRNEEDVRSRRRRLRASAIERVCASGIRTVIVFSRVTVGADVAVTSVIVGKLTQAYPDAGIVLVAPPRIGELFAGDSQIRILEAPYPRRGSLIGRLSTWVELLDAVQKETASRTTDEILFVDPDSRLTQLGLLPVTALDAAYRIFESRSYGAGGNDCLGRLASRWAGDVFGNTSEDVWPYLRLSPSHLAAGRNCTARLRRGSSRLVAVSFGVGGNPLKRSGQDFEAELLLRLIGDGHTVVLDKGIESDLIANENVLAALRAQGIRVLETDEHRIGAPGAEGQVDILAWSGGVGLFGSLIASSDLYIGYDSAFQHIAAALGVPVIAVVLGSPGPVFRRRWQPYSKNTVRVIPDDDRHGTAVPSRLADETMAAVRDALAQGIR